MAKEKNIFICSNCGYESAKWYGKCPSCGEWNTLNEEISSDQNNKGSIYQNMAPTKSVKLTEVTGENYSRISTGIKECDRVLGGGIVPGSVTLLCGDPGIGKSTILLQICQLIDRDKKILYVSGEESANQIKIRANRLNVNNENLFLMAQTDVQMIVDEIRTNHPDIVIIDSIQTMNYNECSSSPGSVTQVRESTNIFLHVAKSLNIPFFIVGHVNKDGAIAGPKVLEHVVDTVLYFEGEKNNTYRILRGVKNRFGSTNEIGVFEMCTDGLHEVENPSMFMLSGRPVNTSGSCVACIIEGSRPILAEVQGLVTPTGFGTPRRMSTGFDYNRMAMILAVLEKRAGFEFSTMDAYINVIGGLYIEEPSADLTVAIALVSSLKDIKIKSDIIAFGEIGLAGEIRAVNNCEQRIKESSRIGFNKCIIPFHNYKPLPDNLKKNLVVIPVRTINEAINALKGDN